MDNNNVNNEEMEDMEEEIITLSNEKGEEIEFINIAVVDYEEKWYIVLEPVDPSKAEMEEGEVVICEVTDNEDGSQNILPVQDEAILDAVFNEFMAMVEEDGCCDDDCDCCHHHCDCDDCSGEN